VVLPTATNPVSKEVLFHVIDNICKAAKNNEIIRQMFDNFIRSLIKGVYASQSNGKHSELVSEHGDLIKLILTGNRFLDQPKRNHDCRFEDISSERGDLIHNVTKLDTFNLLTLFGEPNNLTNIDNDSDDFKYSDFLDDFINGEIDGHVSSTPPPWCST